MVLPISAQFNYNEEKMRVEFNCKAAMTSSYYEFLIFVFIFYTPKPLFMYALSNLNWLHVLVAAIAYFILGAIWYSFLFQKQWIRYHKIDMNDPEGKKGVGMIMFTSFIWTFIICTGLAILIFKTPMAGGAMSGIKLGLTTGVCFSALAISMTYLYLKKPAGLHFIDGLYHVVGQIIAAIILILWK
jgi:hypothetical protein